MSDLATQWLRFLFPAFCPVVITDFRFRFIPCEMDAFCLLFWAVLWNEHINGWISNESQKFFICGILAIVGAGCRFYFIGCRTPAVWGMLVCCRLLLFGCSLPKAHRYVNLQGRAEMINSVICCHFERGLPVFVYPMWRTAAHWWLLLWCRLFWVVMWKKLTGGLINNETAAIFICYIIPIVIAQFLF